MQHDQDATSTRTEGGRESPRSTVGALTAIGVIAYLASRLAPDGTASTLMGLVSLVPLGAAVAIAIRRRLGGAIVAPAVLFVGVALLSAVRLA